MRSVGGKRPTTSDIKRSVVVAARTPSTPEKRRFLELLVSDLQRLGCQAALCARSKHLDFVGSIPSGSRTAPRRGPGDQTNTGPLLRRVASGSLSQHFIDGASLDLDAIDIRVVVCATPRENDLFSYAKLLQTVPSAPRVRRRIRLLAWDVGQFVPALMGVVELASPVWQLACRDRHLEWSGARAPAKVVGLRRMMDLATCIAIPPYNLIRTGKLLAAVACSETAAAEFDRRYGEELLGIMATSATGIHYPHVNRIRLQGRSIYRRVGLTAGYSVAGFSGATLAAARQLVQGGQASGSFDEGYTELLQVMRAALRHCGLSEEPVLRLGTRKGVYMGETRKGAVADLRRGTLSDAACPSIETVVAWWRDEILCRARTRADILRALTHEQRGCPPNGSRSVV